MHAHRRRRRAAISWLDGRSAHRRTSPAGIVRPALARQIAAAGGRDPGLLAAEYRPVRRPHHGLHRRRGAGEAGGAGGVDVGRDLPGIGLPTPRGLRRHHRLRGLRQDQPAPDRLGGAPARQPGAIRAGVDTRPQRPAKPRRIRGTDRVALWPGRPAGLLRRHRLLFRRVGCPGTRRAHRYQSGAGCLC